MVNTSETYDSQTHDCVFRGTFLGKDQRTNGIYRLEFHRNYGEEDQSVLDKVNAICLWGPVDWGIVKGEDPDGLVSTVVELESELAVYTPGEFNPDDYYTKTETDTLLSAKQNLLQWTLTPTIGATNAVVSSDGVAQALQAKQNTLTFDENPTQGSLNPVTSNGLYRAFSEKQDTISDLSDIRSGAAAGATALQDAPSDGKQYARKNAAWSEITIPSITTDATPTEGSTNPVQSGGVYAALQGKQSTLIFGTSLKLSSADSIKIGPLTARLEEMETQDSKYLGEDSFIVCQNYIGAGQLVSQSVSIAKGKQIIVVWPTSSEFIGVSSDNGSTYTSLAPNTPYTVPDLGQDTTPIMFKCGGDNGDAIPVIYKVVDVAMTTTDAAKRIKGVEDTIGDITTTLSSINTALEAII